MEKPPAKSTAREVTEAVIEGAAGMVPIAGSPIAVALSFAMGLAYNRRMQAWLEDLAEVVTELQERLDGWPSFEELADDDVFVDAVVNASRAAQATHSDEKLEALRNGVLNSLGPDAPTVDEQARFFRLVDEFTAGHLRLLAFLDDPAAFFERVGVPRPNLSMGGRSSLLEVLPEFRGRRDWYDLLASDLTAARLTNFGGLHTTQTGGSLWEPAMSDLGRRFLAFVTDPRD